MKLDLQLSGLRPDLREYQRLPVGMELRLSWRSGDVTYIGTGRTRNLNDRAVCFETDQDIRDRADVEVRIPWPSRLQNICPLELVLRGSLVRKSPGVAILQMESYEFQTHGDHSFNHFSERGVTCNIAA